MTSSESHSWKTLAAGELIPSDAVSGGTTAKYGEMYIGRSGGQVGRITVNLDGFAPNQVKKMDRFYYHGEGSWFGFGHKECEILLSSKKPLWIPISRNDSLPENAVEAGNTRTDGVTHVGRSREKDDIGKLNLHDGRMYNFWCQSKSGGSKEAEVLVFESIPVVVARPALQNPVQPVVRGMVQDPLGAVQQPEQAPVQPPVEKRSVERPRPVDVVLPSAPSKFSGTNELSVDWMKELSANSPWLDDWLTDQKEVKEHNERANNLRNETQGMAYDVLDMEAECERIQRDFESSAQVLTSAQSRVQVLLSERQKIVEKQSSDEICRILNANAKSADSSAYQALEAALGAPNDLEGDRLAEFKQSYLRHKTEVHRCTALSDSLKNSAGAQ